MNDLANKPHKQATAVKMPQADREMFDAMDREKLYEYIFMQIKNIWRVDGLYFLGIEKRHDMEEATDVDAECWKYMGKTEAREIKKFLGIENPDPAQLLMMLRHTSWAVSHEIKDFGVDDDGTAWFSVIKCRTQMIRLDKGLDPHPCRMVREGYLEAFTTECNAEVVLETVSCPPDQTIDDVWCLWRFRKA